MINHKTLMEVFLQECLLYIQAAKANKHNFRASYQTGFRNPITQDQYIGFNVGSAVLIGSAPDNLTRYTETRPVANGTPAVGQVYAGGASVIMTGVNCLSKFLY